MDGTTTWLEGSVLENLNDVIYMVEGDVFAGRVRFVNRQVERLLGYRPQDFIDDPELWINSVHPDDLPKLLSATRIMLERREPVTRLFRVRHRSENRYVCFEDRVVPKFDADGRLAGILGVARDVTARRQAEAALESSLRQFERADSLGRFAAGIAHDLNNSFAVLMPACERMRTANDLPRLLQEELAVVGRALAHSLALTRRLVAFVQGRPAAAVPLDLNAVITELVPLLRRLVGSHIRVVTDLDVSLRPIRGDIGQIEQVLLNLAGNARDAMQDGGRLTIVTRNLDAGACGAAGENASRVALTVSDTGAGMDEEARRQLFEPFFTTKPEGSGTGLGLATVHRIVEDAGGRIVVSTEPGCGTRFEILLPAL